MIELLIVVAIILIIAAVAIPNLLRARIAANESSAASSVRSIATAEVTYNAAYPTLGYAAALSNLGGLPTGCTPSSTTACLIDSVLSTGVKSGYAFAATGFPSGGSPVNPRICGGCCPIRVESDGVRNFCIITDGVLRTIGGIGRIAGPRHSDLRGLHDRPIEQRFQPVPVWCATLGFRDQSPALYFRNAAYSARHSSPHRD